MSDITEPKESPDIAGGQKDTRSRYQKICDDHPRAMPLITLFGGVAVGAGVLWGITQWSQSGEAITANLLETVEGKQATITPIGDSERFFLIDTGSEVTIFDAQNPGDECWKHESAANIKLESDQTGEGGVNLDTSGNINLGRGFSLEKTDITPEFERLLLDLAYQVCQMDIPDADKLDYIEQNILARIPKTQVSQETSAPLENKF